MSAEKTGDSTLHKEHKPTYQVIGTRPIRQDGTDKVTGRAQFGADINLPGMLFGAVSCPATESAMLVPEVYEEMSYGIASG